MSLEMLMLPISIAFAAIYYAYSKSKYHVKPRTSFAQVALIGRTEDSETLQITVSLFNDETPFQWDQKLKTIYELREKRLKFQNERIQELQKEIAAQREEAAAQAANNNSDKASNIVAMTKD